jgi:hypothetical protein
MLADDSGTATGALGDGSDISDLEFSD